MVTSFQCLIDQLEILGLEEMALCLSTNDLTEDQKNMTKLEFLMDLVQEEIQAREKERLSQSLKRARFPQIKRFSTYD